MRVRLSKTVDVPIGAVLELARSGRLVPTIHAFRHRFEGVDMTVSVPVDLSIAPPTLIDKPIQSVVQPIEARATKRAGLYPVLEAAIEVTRVDQHSSEVAIEGEYRAPGRMAGAVIDRLVLGGISRDVLDQILDAVTRHVTSTCAKDSQLTGIPF